MDSLPKHPGFIKMVDSFTKVVSMRNIRDVPLRQQFLFMKNGDAINDPDKATEIIPIVEVIITPLDARGEITSKANAKKIQIIEYGPNKKLLRSTLMVKT